MPISPQAVDTGTDINKMSLVVRFRVRCVLGFPGVEAKNSRVEYRQVTRPDVNICKSRYFVGSRLEKVENPAFGPKR